MEYTEVEKFQETFLVLVELMANGEKDRVTKREKFIKPGYVQPCSSCEGKDLKGGKMWVR